MLRTAATAVRLWSSRAIATSSCSTLPARRSGRPKRPRPVTDPGPARPGGDLMLKLTSSECRPSTWRHWCRSVALVILIAAPAAAGTTSVQTTTTTYQYNADGAPTAVTTQVDDGPASTVYLT